MALLGAMSTVLTLGIGTVAPYIVIAAVTLFALASVVVVRRNERVRPLLSTGWSPLLGAVVVSSASGRVLDAFVTRYEGYAFLAVVFGGMCTLLQAQLYLALTSSLRSPRRRGLDLRLAPIDRVARRCVGHHAAAGCRVTWRQQNAP
jgi:hypothetical protein